MEETIFPPSVNWFLSRNLSCSEDGSIAYGAKNSIVILPAAGIQPLIIDNAHDARVTAISFSPRNSQSKIGNSIVTSGDDGCVKLWNADALTLLACQKLHWDSKQQRGRVVCLDWSQTETEFVVSAGENDTLVSWNVSTNVGTKFDFARLQPTVISCRPDEGKIVAVGSRSGLIFIVALVDGGKVLNKLRGHDSEVQSVSWCPAKNNVFRTLEIEERLLATSCKDQEIYVWRAGSDGGCETILRLPSGPLSKAGREKQRFKGNAASTFIAVFWGEPQKIYTGTLFGELVFFDVAKYVNSVESDCQLHKQAKSNVKTVWELVHDIHSRSVFAICGGLWNPSHLEKKFINGGITLNGKIECDSDNQIISESPCFWIWSAGSDQKLVACKIVNDECEWIKNFNTLNGFAYCAASSSHDPNRIAIAGGDGIVRLWNLTEATGDVRIFWQKIKDKVMFVAWHPSKDGLLAYGTSEGRIGVLETQSNKPPVLFKMVHPQPVYRLSWGPFIREESDLNDFALYAIVNNTLFQYDLLKPTEAPLNVSKAIAFPCKKQTDVCWNQDFSLLAIGNEDGTICVTRPADPEAFVVVSAYRKTIQSIAWHPVSTVLDSSYSPYRGYFACGTTDKNNDIRVFNCSVKEQKISVDEVALLKGHQDYLQHVSWSPHEGGRLVSSGADCSVRIWDVISQTLLLVFVPNKERMPLFSVWSPVDPDFIITGCRNKMLLVWKISATETCEPLDRVKNKKRKKTKFSNAQKEPILENSSEVGNFKDREEKLEIKSVALAKPEVVKIVKESKMFSKTWKGEPDDPIHCYRLLKDEEKNISFNLGFLENEAQWISFLDNEVASKKKSNSWEEVYELSLWRGDLKETVEEKIKSGQLNDFLVSLTPMVSPRLWQEACTAYSKSLAEKKQYRKAASYLVACHKIKEAVELLVDADLFLEAACIARSRYSENGAEVKDVIRKYACWLMKTGSFARACECFIYLKDYADAAKIMSKRNEAEYLCVASLAAKKAGLDVLASSTSNCAMSKCLLNRNWDLARNIYHDHPNLKHLKLLYYAYDSICKLNEGQLILKKDIVSHVKNVSEIDADAESYAALRCPYDKNLFYGNEQEMMMCVAREVALSSCAVDAEMALTHVVRALGSVSRYVPEKETRPLSFFLCQWYAPEGFLAENSIFAEKDVVEPKITSLRAFLCEALIEILGKETEDGRISSILKTLEAVKKDLFDLENVKYFKNLVRIKSYEKKLMDARFKKNSSDCGPGDVKNDEESTALDAEILSILRKEVEEFESRRITCPNPLVAFCKLRNAVSNLPTGHDLLREIEESSFGKSLMSDD